MSFRVERDIFISRQRQRGCGAVQRNTRQIAYLAAASAVNTRTAGEIKMKLIEIAAVTAAEQRVKRLRASAKAAKDRAKQLKAQADINAEQLAMRKSRAALTQAQRSTATSTIKPYR